MKPIAFFFLLFVFLHAEGQIGPPRNWIDSEIKYTDNKGNLVKFVHSLPRGGGVVYKNGQKYTYLNFWTRVFNQSSTPIKLNIKFPEITFLKPPDSYIEILLPKQTMRIEKVQLFDYGLTNMQSFFNDKTNQLSTLNKKINPKNEYLFYVTVFTHIGGSGSARAKFELKGQDLFYKISIGQDIISIPCGILNFFNSATKVDGDKIILK